MPHPFGFEYGSGTLRGRTVPDVEGDDEDDEEEEVDEETADFDPEPEGEPAVF
jgi:hypothetical protein